VVARHGGENTEKSRVLALVGLLALVAVVPASATVSADTMQSNSSYPEVPAGNSPQPNGDGGNGGNGTPQSHSAVPEVPAGATPQPN